MKRKCSFKHVLPFAKDNVLRYKGFDQKNFNFINDEEVLLLLDKWGLSLEEEIPIARSTWNILPCKFRLKGILSSVRNRRCELFATPPEDSSDPQDIPESHNLIQIASW